MSDQNMSHLCSAKMDIMVLMCKLDILNCFISNIDHSEMKSKIVEKIKKSYKYLFRYIYSQSYYLIGYQLTILIFTMPYFPCTKLHATHV